MSESSDLVGMGGGQYTPGAAAYLAKAGKERKILDPRIFLFMLTMPFLHSVKKRC